LLLTVILSTEPFDFQGLDLFPQRRNRWPGRFVKRSS